MYLCFGKIVKLLNLIRISYIDFSGKGIKPQSLTTVHGVQ